MTFWRRCGLGSDRSATAPSLCLRCSNLVGERGQPCLVAQVGITANDALALRRGARGDTTSPAHRALLHRLRPRRDVVGLGRSRQRGATARCLVRRRQWLGWRHPWRDLQRTLALGSSDGSAGLLDLCPCLGAEPTGWFTRQHLGRPLTGVLAPTIDWCCWFFGWRGCSLGGGNLRRWGQRDVGRCWRQRFASSVDGITAELQSFQLIALVSRQLAGAALQQRDALLDGVELAGLRRGAAAALEVVEEFLQVSLLGALGTGQCALACQPVETVLGVAVGVVVLVADVADLRSDRSHLRPRARHLDARWRQLTWRRCGRRGQDLRRRLADWPRRWRLGGRDVAGIEVVEPPLQLGDLLVLGSGT